MSAREQQVRNMKEGMRPLNAIRKRMLHEQDDQFYPCPMHHSPDCVRMSSLFFHTA